MRLVKLPTIANKYLDTIVHSILSLFHAVVREAPDLIYVCGQGNAVTLVIPRIYCIPVVINVDGPDWQRKKWNRFASWFLRVSEQVAVQLGVDAPSAKRQAEENKVRVQDSVTRVLVPRTLEQIRGTAREEMKEAIRDELNKWLGGHVVEIYFTKFVIQ